MINYIIKDNDAGDYTHALTAFRTYCSDARADGFTDFTAADLKAHFEYWITDLQAFRTVTVYEIEEYFTRPAADAIEFYF